MGYLDKYFTQPQEPEEEERPLVVPERGLIGDIGTSALRGLSVLSESAWRATEPIFGETNFDEEIRERRETSKWMAPDVSEYLGREGLVKKGLTGAIEALPSSLGPAGAGAAIGTAILPGLGTLAGATLGAAAGTLGFFGLSEGRRAYKEGLEQGFNEEDAIAYGWKKGLTEGGLETAAIVADIMIPFSGRLAKVGSAARKGATKASVNNILRQEPRKYATDLLKIWSAENITEQAQLEMGAAIDRQYGLKGEVTWEERAETIATTTWMSMFFGLGASGINVTERAAIKKDLLNPETQARGANKLYNLLKAEQPEVAENFRTVYEESQLTGRNWSIQDDLTLRTEEIVNEARQEAETRQEGELLYEAYDPDVPVQQTMAPINEVLREEGIPIEEELPKDGSIEALRDAAQASPRAADDPKLAANVDLIHRAQAGEDVMPGARPPQAPQQPTEPQPVPQATPEQTLSTEPNRPLPEPTPQEPVVQEVPEDTVTVTPEEQALAGPEKLEPRTLDTITVPYQVIEEETGEVVEIEVTAREAIQEADTKIESWYTIRECLQS